MATQVDIDGLALKLNTTAPLTWIVADCPVVAVLKNAEILGQPLDRNGCGDLLRLWIGFNVETRELFVTLTIRIRVSPVRKKTRRQGRLMFLVVPAESLHLQTASIGYAGLRNELSQCLFDMPHDDESAKCKLLRMSLSTAGGKSYVIMPEYQCRSNVLPQAMNLLRKLKMLSEASSFHLYTNHDEACQAALENLSSTLLDKVTVVTPSVTLSGFYPGGRSACVDRWMEQGWLDETKTDGQAKDKNPAVNQNAMSEALDLLPPPPYESDNVQPPIPSPLDRCPVPDSPSNIAPPVQVEDLLPTVPFSSLEPLDENVVTATKSDPAVDYQTLACVGADLSHLPQNSPSSSIQSLSSNYTATFLSGFPSISPLIQARNALPAQKEATTRQGSRLSAQVAASTPDRSFCKNEAAHITTSGSSSDRVPDSLSRKRLPSYSSEEGANLSFKRAATAKHMSRSLFFDDLRAGFSPTVADTTSNYGDQTGFCFENQLSQWLSRAWEHCPQAHYLFAAELLSYGAAISANQSDDNIATCHLNCTLALLSHCIKKDSAHRLTNVNHQISDETKDLIKWLYALRPGADMDLFQSLLALSLLEQRSCSVQAIEEESAAQVTNCNSCRAAIVSQACIRFGATVLATGQDAVMTRMLRQEDTPRI